MSQITRTTVDIVLKALKLANIFRVDEAVDESKISEGIDSLNMILDSFQGSSVMVPFSEDLSFNITEGQETYYFGYNPSVTVTSSKTLIDLQFCKMALNDAVYPVKIINNSERQQESLYHVSSTIPAFAYFSRSNAYSEISFIHPPSSGIVCTISGKFALTTVTRYQTLTNLPPYSNRFLIYALARELYSIYKAGDWDQIKENEYQKMLSHFTVDNDLDLTSRADNIFNRKIWTYNYYAQ